jgi:urocanate hydratase
MGVIRHADAGYEKAHRIAAERGLDRPGIQSADVVGAHGTGSK